MLNIDICDVFCMSMYSVLFLVSLQQFSGSYSHTSLTGPGATLGIKVSMSEMPQRMLNTSLAQNANNYHKCVQY